jgi:hypothetical protein
MTAHEACNLKLARPSGSRQYSVYCIEHFSRIWHTPTGRYVMSYDVTLERRIRELCAQAVATKDAAQLQTILTELRDALRQHTEQLKDLVGDYPFAPDIGKSVA